MIKPNDVITDGTVKWTVRKIGDVDKTSLVPTGTILAFAGNGTIPKGYLLCDGSAVDRANYAALFAVIGTAYGAGDGSTTFNLPDTMSRYLRGSNSVGEYQTAGLPNITGTVQNCLVDNALTDPSQGALKATRGTILYGGGAGDTKPKATLSINASLSSLIYGRSNTVRPENIAIRFIIKY